MNIHELRQHLAEKEARLQAGGPTRRSLPASVRKPPETAELLNLAREYLHAAEVVYADDTQRGEPGSNPWFQLIGQSLELALKAGIDASGAERKGNTHNLRELCEIAEAAGLKLGDHHAHALIVHLDNFYHESLASGVKYGVRYGGHGGGSIPPHARLSAVIERLCEQAEVCNRTLLNAP